MSRISFSLDKIRVRPYSCGISTDMSIVTQCTAIITQLTRIERQLTEDWAKWNREHPYIPKGRRGGGVQANQPAPKMTKSKTFQQRIDAIRTAQKNLGPKKSLAEVPQTLQDELDEIQARQKTWGTKKSLAEWEQAKTTEALESQAERKWPELKAEFAGCDVKTIQTTMKTYEQLAKAYPDVAHAMRYIGTRKNSGYVWDDSSYAHYPPRSIGLNPKWYGADATKKFSDSLADCAVTEWHPARTNNISGVVAHEFGHAVHDYYTHSGHGGLKSVLPGGVMTNTGSGGAGLLCRTLLPEIHQGLKQRDTGGRPELSGYALSNDEETFAEAFSAAWHGNTESLATRQIMALVKTVRTAKPYKVLRPGPKSGKANAQWNTLLTSIRNIT
jgi:hypothetical protein